MYSQAWVRQSMISVFADFKGYYGNPAVRSCGVEWPGVTSISLRLRKNEQHFFEVTDSQPGRGQNRRNEDFTWRRRWSPNSGDRPMNRGDDSLPTRRAPTTANSPNGGNPMKTEVSRIPAESHKNNASSGNDPARH